MNPQLNSSTILMVEDNPDDYEAAVRSFKEADMENPIHWCKNGKDALDYLKHEGKYANDSNAARPALVLLDLNIPGIDGRKALSLMREDKALQKIPVIILTTSGDEEDMRQCYELGALTYIQKPVNFDGLTEAVTSIKNHWLGVAARLAEEG